MNWFRILFGLALCLALAAPVVASEDPIYTSYRNNKAVGGYDVVSFHFEKPVKGERTHSIRWRGADWFFANTTNLQNFANNPEKYAPAYGGYCAWAVAHDKLAKGSPKHWSIIDNVLYLNYSDRIKKRWLKTPDLFIEDGNKKWPGLIGVPNKTETEQ